MTDTKQKPRTYANFDRFYQAAPRDIKSLRQFLAVYKESRVPMFYYSGVALYFYSMSGWVLWNGTASLNIAAKSSTKLSWQEYRADFGIVTGAKISRGSVPELEVTLTDYRRTKRLADGRALLVDDSTGQPYSFSGEPIAHPLKPC